MRKRVLALILGTMLVLSLAACGGSDDAAEADTTATEETDVYKRQLYAP